MTKLERINDLSEQTEKAVIRTQENWTAHLRTAAQVYKYPFSDQLLIISLRQHPVLVQAHEALG